LYENKQSKYDTPVLDYLVQNGKNSVLRNSDLYVYTIHNNTNASSSSHLDDLYATGTKIKKDTSHISNLFT
jgi:hypothetical protein